MPFTMKLLFLLFFFSVSFTFYIIFRLLTRSGKVCKSVELNGKYRVLNPSTCTAFPPPPILFLACPLLGTFHNWLSENHSLFFKYHLKIAFFFKVGLFVACLFSAQSINPIRANTEFIIAYHLVPKI